MEVKLNLRNASKTKLNIEAIDYVLTNYTLPVHIEQPLRDTKYILLSIKDKLDSQGGLEY